MKMVAAAKLKRAQDKLIGVAPFADGIAQMICNVYHMVEKDDLPKYLNGNPDLPHLYIFITADRGLCGSFSTNVMREFRSQITRTPNFKAIALGKKGIDFLKREFKDHQLIYDVVDAKNGFSPHDAMALSARVVDMLKSGDIGAVTIVSTRFFNVIKQIPESIAVVPFHMPQPDTDFQDIIFEPKPHKLIEFLFEKYFASLFYHRYIESITSENASRMTAMDGATRNAKEMIKNLQLKYNRTRQTMITKEIIEIISGAEAI